MNVKKTKLIAFLTLLIFTTSSYACGPLTPLCLLLFGAAEAGTGAAAAGAGEVAAVEFLATTGARYTMTQATTNSLAIHGGIAAITFGSAAALSSQTPSKPAPLQIILDPNKPLITPQNWTQAVLGKIQPTPPFSYPLGVDYYNYINHTLYKTPNEAYQAGLQLFSGGVNNNVIISSGVYPNTDFVYSQGGVNYASNIAIGSQLNCSLGYTDNTNNSTCELIHANQVLKPSDNVCQLLTTPTTIIPDPSDPDCKSADLLANGIDATDPSKLIITNPSKTDQHIVTPIDPHRVQVEHVYKDPIGNTIHDKLLIDPLPSTPDGSPIRGYSHDVNPGQGELEKGIATPGTILFDKSGLSTTANQETQIARQSEANTTLKSIESKIDCPECIAADTSSSDKSKVDTEVKKTTDLIESQGQAVQNQADESLFTTGISAVIPSGGSCEPFSKTISGKSITIDTCPTMNLIQQTLGWLYALFGGYTILGLIFRKP